MNKEITIACIENDVKKYEIADKLGITDTSFSRKLRKELLEDEKQEILEIISEISKSKE